MGLVLVLVIGLAEPTEDMLAQWLVLGVLGGKIVSQRPEVAETTGSWIPSEPSDIDQRKPLEWRTVALESLLVDPGQLVRPGEYRPDVLVEVCSGVFFVVCPLVDVLEDIVEGRWRLDAPSKLRWPTEDRGLVRLPTPQRKVRKLPSVEKDLTTHRSASLGALG